MESHIKKHGGVCWDSVPYRCTSCLDSLTFWNLNYQAIVAPVSVVSNGRDWTFESDRCQVLHMRYVYGRDRIVCYGSGNVPLLSHSKYKLFKIFYESLRDGSVVKSTHIMLLQKTESRVLNTYGRLFQPLGLHLHGDLVTLALWHTQTCVTFINHPEIHIINSKNKS